MEYGLYIVTYLPKLLWGVLKGIFLTLIVYHLFSGILFYPSIGSEGVTITSLFGWASEFVAQNWMYLTALFVLYYSWSNARKMRSIDERAQQIEVISFACAKYFNFWPETELMRKRVSAQNVAKSFVSGWIASLFNIDDPMDRPWTAEPVRDGKGVSFRSDSQKTPEDAV